MALLTLKASFSVTIVCLANAMPDVPLHQVFQGATVPPEIRLRLAAAGILQMDLLFSVDILAGFVSKRKGISGRWDPFGIGPVAIVNGTRLVSVWPKPKACIVGHHPRKAQRGTFHKNPKISDVDYHACMPIELLCCSPLRHHVARK